VMTLGQVDVSFKCNWNKPVHSWYQFHAGCSSEFPEKMIDLLKIERGATILDPFFGSGTILVTAKERGINSIGFDLNPFYAFMAGVKTYWEFELSALFDQIQLLSSKLKARRYLLHKSLTSVDNIPSYIWRYFDAKVLKHLSVLKKVIFEVEIESIRNLLLFALSSILIDVSKVHYVGETIVFDKVAPASGINVYEIFMKKVLEMYSDLKAKQRIKSKGQVEMKVADVRNLETLVPDGSLDHVVAHPPYLNNYNYLLHDRLPMFFLEYFKTIADEKEMRSRILGSVADGKPSAKLLDIPIVQEIACQVKKTRDKKRHEAVIEYCWSMNSFFRGLHDKLREDGFCAMLVGNSYVRGVMVPLDIITVKIAEQNGFLAVENWVVRDRGNGAFQHLYNGKLYESIVILKRP